MVAAFCYGEGITLSKQNVRKFSLENTPMFLFVTDSPESIKNMILLILISIILIQNTQLTSKTIMVLTSVKRFSLSLRFKMDIVM